MNQARKLVIITNEKISKDEDKFYCDNVDMKSIPEGLSTNLNVSLIARKSNIRRSHQTNLENIKTSSNIITFCCKIMFSI